MLHPRYRFRNVTQISPDWLARHGISVLLLDVDNTLTTHGSPQVSAQVRAWLDSLRARGIRLLILSNNSEQRVKPLAELLGLGYIARAAKPLGFSLKPAFLRLGISQEKAAIVGDQIFTDVLCANLAGLVSILVEPFEPEAFWGFRIKRRLERGILRRAPAFEEENR